jgi:hypothetical protein
LRTFGSSLAMFAFVRLVVDAVVLILVMAFGTAPDPIE